MEEMESLTDTINTYIKEIMLDCECSEDEAIEIVTKNTLLYMQGDSFKNTHRDIKYSRDDVLIIGTGEISTTKDRTRYLCKECHGEFTTTPLALSNGVKCPHCKRAEYLNELGVSEDDLDSNLSSFYMYQIEDKLGYGITSDIETRLREHRRNLISNNYEHKLLHIFKGSHDMVLMFENHCKLSYEIRGIEVIGFKTECCSFEDYDSVLNDAKEWFGL